MKVYIWSFEHTMWWKPNSQGYTSDIKEAGEYVLDKAIQICIHANIAGKINEAIVPVGDVQDYIGISGDEK